MNRVRVEPLTDGSDRMVVDLLTQYRVELIDLGDPPVEFVLGTWEGWLTSFGGPNAAPTLRDHVQGALGRHANPGITRSDIRELAHTTATAQSRAELFVVTFAWGRGKKNARLFPAWSSAWSDWERLDSVLDTTRQLVLERLPGEAYDAFAGEFHGIGESFFTKWLWAVGTGFPADGEGLVPLILDERVWRSLRRIGWQSWRDSGFRYRVNPAAAYTSYLHAAKRWASQLSSDGLPVTPEQIETFLFTKAGNL